MIKYVFRNELPLTIKNARKADAQKIGEALHKITNAAGKRTPHAVVEAARAEKHVLHRHFEWKDAIAAEAYRLDQARALIRCIDVVTNDDEPPMRAFISITEKNGTAYHTNNEVLGNLELQVIVLRQAERDFLAYEKRLREFQDLCDAVRKAREKIAAKRAKLEDEARP
jgi:transposase